MMYFGQAVLLLRYKRSSNAWSSTERRRKESNERQKRIQGQTLYSKLFGEHSEVVIKWLAMIQGLWVQVVYVSAAVAIVIQAKLVKVWWQECTSCLYASFTDYSGCVSLRLLFLLYGLSFQKSPKMCRCFLYAPHMRSRSLLAQLRRGWIKVQNNVDTRYASTLRQTLLF